MKITKRSRYGLTANQLLTTVLVLTITGVVLLGVELVMHKKEGDKFSTVVESFDQLNTKSLQIPEVESEEKIATMAVDLKGYKERNEDTVSYMHIPSIELGIPVVQANDNEYYLTRDFEQRESRLGWVFLDSRSAENRLEQNMVVYGHNVVAENMFGNLKSLLNPAKDTSYIYYNTETSKRVYEIVSTYVTHYEDWGYTKVKFTEQEKGEFITRVKERNTVKSYAEKEVELKDKFITLSTCYGVIGTTKRLVVHAKLVKEEKIVDGDI